MRGTPILAYLITRDYATTLALSCLRQLLTREQPRGKSIVKTTVGIEEAQGGDVTPSASRVTASLNSIDRLSKPFKCPGSATPTRASDKPARKRRKVNYAGADGSVDDNSVKPYTNEERLALATRDVNRFPVFKARDKEVAFRQRFRVPLINKSAGDYDSSRPAPTLGMRQGATFVVKPLHDPSGEFAIVLYDPTVDDVEDPEAKKQEDEAEESKALDEPLVHKSLADILGLKKKVEDRPKVPVVIDPKIAKILRPHQVEGVKFLYRCTTGMVDKNAHGCIMADGMGLGKTLQCIALMWTLLRQSPEAGKTTIQKCIIACPSSLVGNWANELGKWLGKGTITPFAVDGKASKTELTSQMKQWAIASGRSIVRPVLIVSYETLRMYVDTLKDSPIGLLLCDEGHRLKNKESLTWTALNSLNVQRRVILSGTPIQNDLSEYFALLNFANPDLLGSQNEFRKRFELPILKGRDAAGTEEDRKKGDERLAELSGIVNKFIIRRTNDILSKYLPIKYEHVVFCNLSPFQLALYKHFIASPEIKSLLRGKGSQPLKAIGLLKKLCNHPDLLNLSTDLPGCEHTFPDDYVPPDSRGRDRDIRAWYSGKMMVLDRMLARIRQDTNDKIVLISNYTQTLDLFEKLCRSRQYGCLRLDGTMNVNKRSKLVDKFNDPNGEEFVFLLSSKAGGCGLNLIGANRLVLFDPDWNPAADQQALARVWRDGQKKDCFVYRFIATGSIEEKIFQRQSHKQSLSSCVVDSAEDVERHFSLESLRELFQFKPETTSDTHDTFKCKRCRPDGTQYIKAPAMLYGDTSSWNHFVNNGDDGQLSKIQDLLIRQETQERDVSTLEERSCSSPPKLSHHDRGLGWRSLESILEKVVRDSAFRGDHETIQKIVDQLCHDYAYAVHQPHARNGGLIGLAAASIALGSEGVAPYLKEIVPPVLACFSDQDARVRYYACESMYNIAKVAKGEILLFFNEIFDALSKLAADSELSVKNGAELLDRLVKDIVSESAAHHVSVLQLSEKQAADPNGLTETELPTAFSLPKFIPLLKERICVNNASTRMFLVSWLTLLDTIPDLELVSYLPEFLGGLINFLGDQNRDVNVATKGLLDRFLTEIKRIASLNKGLEESRKGQGSGSRPSAASDSVSLATDPAPADPTPASETESQDNAIDDSEGGSNATEEDGLNADGDWIPGQDVQIDYPKILDILVGFVKTSDDEEMQLTALRWMESFFQISPEDILPFVPRLLELVLPALSSGSDQVRNAASGVNTSLLHYIYGLTLSEDALDDPRQLSSNVSGTTTKEFIERRASTPASRTDSAAIDSKKASPRNSIASAAVPTPVDLDYGRAVSSLTLQFLNEHEVTRVAAMDWLLMLHSKGPKKVAAFNDGIFPALLKTLSDPAEAVVTKDLQLLSQISRTSEDSYFKVFMVNLLQLFSTDRNLLEVRGNLIIRQLCVNLSPERIYRTLADCLEKEDDIEFASIMVQNLNNNLITAPELSGLRKRLRNLDTREGQTFFVSLFRSWCHNAVSTFSLCLLAQAYEQAYNLLQIFAELEMTVNMLIQIDKLVQLLESPVFTYLRLQLLEPEKYPYLYKCLYGVLMLLPQSSAFAALKNRLNSVSNIGLLHPGPRLATMSSTSSASSTYDRTSARLKQRDENSIRWVELLDKFKSVQEKTRSSQRQPQPARPFDPENGPSSALSHAALTSTLSASDKARRDKTLPDPPRPGFGATGGRSSPADGGATQKGGSILGGQKQKSGLPNLGRLRIGGGKNKR
ncbi:vacuolar protein 14 C-terminal Fig4p binding-domain-containing protein [Aspergillus egyptiacus]|nr:vacuolar protein 14 C-terminal Fig4p binding-domain-containing protein [Aspergillus egyptiacus]